MQRGTLVTELKIPLDVLTEDEAYALGQMCKRMRWEDFNKLSSNRSEHDATDSATSNSDAHTPKRI
jgi:hypothetical protein